VGYAIAVVFGFLAGWLLYHIAFARKIGCSGRPASMRRLKPRHWYYIVAITGHRTISVRDITEGEIGKENPISIKLSLFDMFGTKTNSWMRIVRKDGKWSAEFAQDEPCGDETTHIKAKV
jgi:hypothetical protein